MSRRRGGPDRVTDLGRPGHEASGRRISDRAEPAAAVDGPQSRPATELGRSAAAKTNPLSAFPESTLDADILVTLN